MSKEVVYMSCDEGLCVEPQNKQVVKRVLENDPTGENIPTRCVGPLCANCLAIKKLDVTLDKEIKRAFPQKALKRERV